MLTSAASYQLLSDGSAETTATTVDSPSQSNSQTFSPGGPTSVVVSPVVLSAATSTRNSRRHACRGRVTFGSDGVGLAVLDPGGRQRARPVGAGVGGEDEQSLPVRRPGDLLARPADGTHRPGFTEVATQQIRRQQAGVVAIGAEGEPLPVRRPARERVEPRPAGQRARSAPGATSHRPACCPCGGSVHAAVEDAARYPPSVRRDHCLGRPGAASAAPPSSPAAGRPARPRRRAAGRADVW